MSDNVQNDTTITIDEREFNLADLSDEAKTQINNLRATDAEIGRIQQQLVIFQTARAVYARLLKAQLPES